MGWVAVNPGNPSEPVSSSCFTRSDSITPLVQIQILGLQLMSTKEKCQKAGRVWPQVSCIWSSQVRAYVQVVGFRGSTMGRRGMSSCVSWLQSHGTPVHPCTPVRPSRPIVNATSCPGSAGCVQEFANSPKYMLDR